MTHNLILNYGLYRKLCVVRPRRATSADMMQFHSDEYVKFLCTINPDSPEDIARNMQKYNVGEDCPAFGGLYDFCQMSAGGSIGAANRLNNCKADIAINWAGGMHHAKKAEASGFCYINDIVLGILELLRFHQRVLYVDIDVHHGDGVEEAFFTTDRVMTVSFHKYGEYFPGTGDLMDVGAGKGKHYAVNFPLRDGIDDESYRTIFEPVMSKVMEVYRPGVVVMQCGSDSLTGDRLGCFNLTLVGHGQCVTFMKKFNVPLMLVGGGGYTIKNVARCWTYETSLALDINIPNNLPYSDYFEFFAPEYQLHLTPSAFPNQNSKEYLDKIRVGVLENLRMVEHAPGIQMQDVPRDPILDDQSDLEMDDESASNKHLDERAARHEQELYDSDDELNNASERSRNCGNIRKRRLEDPIQFSPETVRTAFGADQEESTESDAGRSESTNASSQATSSTRVEMND